MASKEKQYKKDLQAYISGKPTSFGNNINGLYDLIETNTAGGTKWNKDKNISTWEQDIHNSEGMQNYLKSKQQPQTSEATQETTQPAPVSNNSRVIVIKDEDGRDRQVGTTNDESAEKLLTGKAIQNSWKAIANAKVGDFWVGSDDQIHVVTDQDINFSKKKLAEQEASDNPDTDKTNNVNPEDGLLDRLKATSADLNARKADPKAVYTGIPGENARGDIQGYRSVINDVKDLAYANNDLKDARLNDPVRQEAIAAKKEAKDTSAAIKKYDREYTGLIKDLEKTNKKSEKMLIKGMINERKAKLDELQGHLDEINNNFEKQYGMTINDALAGSDKNVDALEAAGIDPEALSALAGEKYNEITDLLGQRAQVNEELDYISNDIKGDIELLLDGNADQSQLEAVYAKIEKLEPKLRETLNNKVNLNKNTLDALGDVVDSLGDDDAKELYQNLQGMAQGFLEQKIDITDENTLKLLDQYSKEFDDIIKNQEMYDKDTRYANDLRLSSFNRMMFNIFDDIKSAIVFVAAIESGNPQVIRSALDQYNYKLQDAENKRKTDQYGAYTENRIREITQDNIARFKKITEIDPDIAKLERVLNLQEGEAGKRQMDALEAGFEEFNKYKNEHPNESVDFAAWVSANRNAGGVLGQIISALLMNFPDLKNAATNLYQSMSNTTDNTNGTNGTSSDETKKEDITNISGTKKRTSSILDGVVGKLSEKNKPEQKDPALMMDIQNTVGQALAAKAAPPQAGAPQAGAPKTNNGFGRTNLA